VASSAHAGAGRARFLALAIRVATGPKQCCNSLMRDVTGSAPPTESIPKYLFKFIKHPVHGVAHLPDWSWGRLFWLQVSAAAVSGTLAALTKPNPFGILAGLIFSPFVSTLMVCFLTAFLYYYFQVFERRTVRSLKLFTLVIFSSLPFFIFQIASSLVPPVTLIGFAFSSMLLAVGLTENFLMEKRRAIRLVGVLFGVVVVMWIGNKVSQFHMDRSGAKSPGIASPLVDEPE
jgi:hypothetical protein